MWSWIGLGVFLFSAIEIYALDDEGLRSMPEKSELNLSVYTVTKTNFAEAVVTLNEESQKEFVQSWFQESGFKVISMRVGLLVTGDAALFDKVFQTPIGVDRGQTQKLPIPDPLKEFVKEVLLPRTPEYLKPSSGE